MRKIEKSSRTTLANTLFHYNDKRPQRKEHMVLQITRLTLHLHIGDLGCKTFFAHLQPPCYLVLTTFKLRFNVEKLKDTEVADLTNSNTALPAI